MAATKLYVEMASEIIALAGYMGLTGLGKKKNVLLRGASLGAIAGLLAVIINAEDEIDLKNTNRDILRKQIETIALYTLGGLAAGGAIKMVNKKKKKK